MNSKTMLSKLVAQICSEDYSRANETLDKVITEKLKKRINNIKNKHEKVPAGGK